MSLKEAVEIIKEHLKNIPAKPGVYRMIDKDENILYIGKAKNLPKRIINYASPERQQYRIQSMISQINKIEITTTQTEAEALLLEANLIKEFEPKYNILLKDGKTYPYIVIDESHQFPRITKYRGKKRPQSSYFGPFPSAGAVNATIKDLQKSFLIRPCTDSYFKNRDRACIEFEIKRCSAPCVDKISIDEYNNLVKLTKDFLSGKSRYVQEYLLEQMHKASDDFRFEDAASFRDRIRALNKIQSKQKINIDNVTDIDVIGVYRENKYCCIQIFFFRGGQNLGNKSYFPIHTEDASVEDIIGAFIGQYYQTNIPPKEVFIPMKIEGINTIEDALSKIALHKVKIVIPKRGEKKNLIEIANKNAEESLNIKISQSQMKKRTFEKLKEIFNLKNIPNRIEVYDNSHIMGKQEYGAMIVAGIDGFDKKSYRKFKIRGEALNKGDDFGMMKEVLKRRFLRTSETLPDLVLIDGGKGQLSAAVEILEELKINIDIVSIAKGPNRNAGLEDFYLTNGSVINFDKNDPILYYLQNIRDEAHRFAIGTHRKARDKDFLKSELDEVPGVGKKRKKDLLQFFGSVNDIKNASTDELQKAPGIDKKIASIIYEYFN